MALVGGKIQIRTIYHLLYISIYLAYKFCTSRNLNFVLLEI